MKRLFAGILVVSLLAGAALAQGPHVFMGIYWVRGQLVRDPAGSAVAAPLTGRTAILYPSTGDPLLTSTRVETTTNATGGFILNPFYNQHLPITLDAGAFAAAVLRQNVAGDPPDRVFGADPVSFGLDPRGWNDVSLTLAENAGPGTVDLVDNGVIRNTSITYFPGEDRIWINWSYDPARVPPRVAVYAQTPATPGMTYDRSASWTVVDGPYDAAGTTRFDPIGLGRNGNNHYFRVVALDAANNPINTGVLGSVPGIHDPTNNSITVGKVEVALPQGRYVFTALPFMEDGLSLAGLLGGQLPLGSEFLWWNGAAYPGATYTQDGAGVRRWTGTDRELRIGEGFLLRAQTADSFVSFVGRFGRLDIPYVRTLPAFPTYNLIAYPAPVSRAIAEMGVTVTAGDDLNAWNGSAYDGATYTVSWVGAAGVSTFGLAGAKFYRTQPGQEWTIAFPAFP